MSNNENFDETKDEMTSASLGHDDDMKRSISMDANEENVEATEAVSDDGSLSSVQSGDVGAPEASTTETSSGSDQTSVGSSGEELPAMSMANSVEQTSSDTPQPKKRSSALIIGIVAVLLIGVGIFAAKGMFKGGGSTNPFLHYHTKLFMDRTAAYNEASLTPDDKISTDITLTATTTGLDEYETYLKDSSVIIKIDSGVDHFLSNVEVDLKGSSLVNGTFHMDKKTLGFYLPEGDGNYYAGDTGKILNTLFDGEVKIDDLFRGTSKKEIEDFGKKWTRIIDSAFTKENVLIEDKEVRLEQLDETIRAKVYTFKPSKEDIQRAFVAFADMIEKDEDFRKMNARFGTSFAYSYLYTSGLDTDATEQELLDTAKRIKEDPAAVSEDYDPELLEWSIAVEKDAVRKLIIRYEGEGMVYESTEPIQKGEFAERIYFLNGTTAIGGMQDNIRFMISNDYEKDGKRYKGSMIFEMKDSGAIELKYDVDLDKKFLFLPYGDYSAMIRELPFGTLSIKVEDGLNDSTDHVFDLRTAFGPSATITLNSTKKSTATKPDMKPVDISDYSKDQLKQLFDENMEIIDGGFEDVLRSLN